MINLTRRRTCAPQSEFSMREVAEGDIVQISIEDDPRRRIVWTLFKGNSQGIDTFIAQDRIEPSEVKLIAIYTPPRNTHKYWHNLGVELSRDTYEIRFIEPRNEKYDSMVKELKEADLWREDNG